MEKKQQNCDEITLDFKGISKEDFLDKKHNYYNFFTWGGEIIQKNNEEKVMIKCDEENKKLLKDKSYVIYALFINNKMLKIGQSETNIINRIGSYNCGKKDYREKGTCSTTNYKILQTMLKAIKNNGKIEILLYFPEVKIEKQECLGEIYEYQACDIKGIEARVVKQFETDFGEKPYCNLQKERVVDKEVKEENTKRFF